jgi:hypothetical protein
MTKSGAVAWLLCAWVLWSSVRTDEPRLESWRVLLGAESLREWSVRQPLWLERLRTANGSEALKSSRVSREDTSCAAAAVRSTLSSGVSPAAPTRVHVARTDPLTCCYT